MPELLRSLSSPRQGVLNPPQAVLKGPCSVQVSSALSNSPCLHGRPLVFFLCMTSPSS